MGCYCMSKGKKKRSAKAEREKLVKEVSRTNDRAAVNTKKKTLTEAKRGKRSALKEARSACKVDKQRTKEASREAYKRTIVRAREKREAKRVEARNRCEVGFRKVEETYNPKIEKTAAELAEERRHQNEIRRIDAANADRAKKRPKATAAERLAEADEAVTTDLPPELIPVWHAVKGSIRASKRRSRREAFLDMVHDDPELVARVHQRIASAEVERLEREASEFYEERKPRKTKARAVERGEDVGDIVAGAFDEVASFFDDLAGPASRSRAA